MHQKDIEEKDPFGQNRADEAEADDDDDDDDEKSFLKALLAERALKNSPCDAISLEYTIHMSTYSCSNLVALPH